MLPKPEAIFSIRDAEDFNEAALQIFHWQAKNIPLYQQYLRLLGRNPENIRHTAQIPFLPISFFKNHRIKPMLQEPHEICFTSSGTSGQQSSRHYVLYPEIYRQSFRASFQQFWGKITDYCILALLPNYLERQGSSLVYMMEDLIRESAHPLSGFYLHQFDSLAATLQTLKQQKQKTLLLGVSYALLDFGALQPELPECTLLMETGGMKGKRKEMTKAALHATLGELYGLRDIASEYGMTELLSQAYSYRNGIYHCPPWMQIHIRETNDPFSQAKAGKGGGINIIDLANLYSCSFIETQDLGKWNSSENGFEILGRIEASDVRGCNLMMPE